MECLDCRTGLDHCHGTLIQHEHLVVECTDADCADFDVVRHRLTVSCEDIVGGCACVATLEIEEFAKAS